MARLSVLSDDVQGVVRALVPILLATGSTAAVCRTLNEALQQQGEARQLHPNRIHALLSDDVGRGVNDATLALTQAALTTVKDTLIEDGEQRLIALRGKAVAIRERSGGGLSEIADALAMPRAVIRAALFAGESKFGIEAAPSAALLRAHGAAPDWSYQDTAVGRVLDAFRRRPDGRIGLVLPTGAGKTRVALRIILERLAAAGPQARVIWLAHRKTLRRQAFKQLGKLLRSGGSLPPDADILANRIVFAMVAELPRLLTEMKTPPALIVVDEGHHAAAASYMRLFEPRPPCPVLLLTATPNRPDQLPIGVEEIAFTITYRELAERGTILIPEFIPFQVPDFDWSKETLDDLIDAIVDETTGRFRKVLVLAPRVDRVEEFHDRLTERLLHEVGHPLAVDDIGYIHGTGNSLGIPDEDFLDRFADKPRAVLVSAQMLLEGFDDPSIDTVILTYPTSSVIRLMQAAGRCVRQDGEKTKAYVMQADNADLAYRFDQRWLYQEISDYLRPELIDVAYGSAEQRRAELEQLLDHHSVAAGARQAAMATAAQVGIDQPVRLLFYGIPYFGPADRFIDTAVWGVFVETPANSEIFRRVFNAFCDMGANLPDPTDFLAKIGPEVGLARDLAPGSLWRTLAELLTTAYFARQELYGSTTYGIQGNRPPRHHGPTSWFRYATLTFEPMVPAALTAFLADCHNRLALEAAYLTDPERYGGAIKAPVPLDGFEGALLETAALDILIDRLGDLASALRAVPPAGRFASLAAALATAEPWPIPAQFSDRLEPLLGQDGRSERLLQL